MTGLENPKPSLEELRGHFKAFRDECFWIRVCHRNYEVLFDTDERTLKLLGAVAVQFFQDLNNVMIEHLWLVSTRILDPAESRGRPNLTVRYLDRALETHDLLSAKIKDASAEVMSFHKTLKDPRNRLVAHLDLEAVMTGEAQGAHEKDEYEVFLRRLQVYLDLVGEVLGEGPLCIAPGGTKGDAIDLVRALRDLLPEEG